MNSGASFNAVAMRGFLSVLAVLIGLSAAPAGLAQADPSTPSPGPATTSTDDEITDMVMAALQDEPTASTETPEPAPPH